MKVETEDILIHIAADDTDLTTNLDVGIITAIDEEIQIEIVMITITLTITIITTRIGITIATHGTGTVGARMKVTAEDTTGDNIKVTIIV